MFTQNEEAISDLEKVELDENETSYIKLSKTKMLFLLLGLSLSIFVSALDNAIVATSATSILNEFKSKDKLTWIAASYLLTDTAFMPLYGKFSDIFGRKLTMLFALFVFLIGSIFSGVASSIEMLIAFRAVSGIGGAGLISLSIIIIADVTPIRKRGLSMAVIEAMFGLSSVAGPLLGGYFSSELTWRWSFYINIPISAVAIIVVYFVLNLPVESQDLMTKLKRIDVLGSFSLVISITLFVLGINWGGNEYSWASVPVIVSLVLSLLIFILFVLNELNWAAEPIVPGHLFNRNVILLSSVAFLNGAVLFVSVFYIPVYFLEVKQYSPIQAGLQLTPMLLGVVICALSSGLFIAKTATFRTLNITGTSIIIISLSLYSLFSKDDAILPIFLNAGIGMGIGFCIQTCAIAAQASSDKKDIAIVSSLITFLQSMGGVFGVAIQGAIYSNNLSSCINKAIPQLDYSFLNNEEARNVYKTMGMEGVFNDCITQSIRLIFLSMIAYAAMSFICAVLVKHVSLNPPKEPSYN